MEPNTSTKLNLDFILNLGKRARPDHFESVAYLEPIAKQPKLYHYHHQYPQDVVLTPYKYDDDKDTTAAHNPHMSTVMLPPLASLFDHQHSKQSLPYAYNPHNNHGYVIPQQQQQQQLPSVAAVTQQQQQQKTVSVAVPRKKEQRKVKQDEEDDENEDDVAALPCEKSMTIGISSDQQLLPIRVLAHNIGLSKDSNKTWRYRDIKRSLMEKMTPEQEKFIDNNAEFAMIKDRLPHKLSMVSFAKRIMLIVFHFIIRDGKVPKFFKRDHVHQDMLEQTLKKAEPAFLHRINQQVAIRVFQLMNAAERMATYEEALTEAWQQLSA